MSPLEFEAKVKEWSEAFKRRAGKNPLRQKRGCTGKKQKV
jgi:hypothetical protein